MGENTEISWCDHTFSPWWGCSKVSPACTHCYAESLANRFGTGWGKTADRRFFGDKHWAEPLAWHCKAVKAGVRARVFCSSMADVFEDRRDLDEHRERLWSLINVTPMLDWLLLTKRPENVLAMTPWAWRVGQHSAPPHTDDPQNWPANAWVGTTVENQRYAAERIPHLLQIPAPVRFLSVEPLLGPLNLKPWSRRISDEARAASEYEWSTSRIDWVIAGGESGPKARPMHPDWVRAIRDECVHWDVPFHFKQWGEWQDGSHGVSPELVALNDGRMLTWDEYRSTFLQTPAALNPCVVAKVGKKVAGRELDGRTWDEYPSGPANR